jgi:hypothetical protein
MPSGEKIAFSKPENSFGQIINPFRFQLLIRHFSYISFTTSPFDFTFERFFAGLNTCIYLYIPKNLDEAL